MPEGGERTFAVGADFPCNNAKADIHPEITEHAEAPPLCLGTGLANEKREGFRALGPLGLFGREIKERLTMAFSNSTIY